MRDGPHKFVIRDGQLQFVPVNMMQEAHTRCS